MAANIRRARTDLGLSQSKLGRLLDVEGLTVSNWERAAYRPNDTNLLRLAELTGHDIAWFYTEHNDEPVAA